MTYDFIAAKRKFWLSAAIEFLIGAFTMLFFCNASIRQC